MRRVKHDAHGQTTDGTSDGNGQDPGEDEQAHTLPVHGPDVAIAQTDTDGGASNAHGSRHGERELREHEDGDGGAHLHGRASARRVVGELVAHDLHDVEAVGDEAGDEREDQNGELPERDLGLRLCGIAGAPGAVDDGPGADGVADVVGAVREGSSAGRDDLDEGVGELDLVGVLLRAGVGALHAGALGRAGDTSLRSVDVVVHTVEGTDDDHGGETLEEEDAHVLELIDLASAHGVVVKRAHGPSEGTAALAKFGVEALLTLAHQLLVGRLRGLVDVVDDHSLLVVNRNLVAVAAVMAVLRRELARLGSLVHFIIVLNDGVVGDLGLLGDILGRALEEKRAHEDVVELDARVPVDDLGVEEGNEEDSGEDGESTAGSERDPGNEFRGLLVEAKLGGALVNDGQRADGAGDEEEEGRGVDGPRDRVRAHVDDDLDEHENAGSL